MACLPVVVVVGPSSLPCVLEHLALICTTGQLSTRHHPTSSHPAQHPPWMTMCPTWHDHGMYHVPHLACTMCPT